MGLTRKVIEQSEQAKFRNPGSSELNLTKMRLPQHCDVNTKLALLTFLQSPKSEKPEPRTVSGEVPTFGRLWPATALKGRQTFRNEVGFDVNSLT